MSKGEPEIYYSEKYYDDEFEYRHVILPEKMAEMIPTDRLLSEREWRGLGITMSRGWVHYGNSPSEPHILLFKREIPQGTPNPRAQQEQEYNEMMKQRKNQN
ncbi:hypothetical protein FDP41_006806 [Naegleria fowleri]|uniref:Cyclin-dependent kinases regulatory subunit n=1 Tax=Naegleria fowleri TaxID=5763 RepID=A0A6A5BHK6_NAEFO|nr:uncharacterized protein FDP41_006806 [Naegleria fowleri]KAF0974196.1 hypothetical protein FDP41_006806 [Naegleria fowleri]CAG4714451.1 unnamed protein product [Naegleria fowleri]